METKKNINGGVFLITNTEPDQVFTPEDFSEEQLMMKEAVMEFIDREVWPNKARFEKKDYAFTESLMKKAGDLGFLSVPVPENYGGMGMGFVITLLWASRQATPSLILPTFKAFIAILNPPLRSPNTFSTGTLVLLKNT